MLKLKVYLLLLQMKNRFSLELFCKRNGKRAFARTNHSEFNYAFDNYKVLQIMIPMVLKKPKETLNWIGVKQQFFTSIIETLMDLRKLKELKKRYKEGEFLKKFNFDGQDKIGRK